MKSIVYFVFVVMVFLGCTQKSSSPSLPEKNISSNDSLSENSAKFALAIHGGAGTILKTHLTPEKEAAYKAKLEEALQTGYLLLKNGGSSLDAVAQTLRVLEDSPLFNAGKGAVFTHAETHELDASLMDGATLNAGASAGTKTVKNPILLARAIMDHSPHVMLSGDGADAFAKAQGLDIVSPDYFYTESRLEVLQRAKDLERAQHGASEVNTTGRVAEDSKFGTVGCVALDKNGNLAAGTSTGGMTNKRWGRIGDSPIIGAGTYANNKTCAVSSTGWGEFFIRGVVAYDISALMEYKGLSLAEAAKEVIQHKLSNLGGNGGIVALDKDGNIVMEFNTAGMYRGSINTEGELYLGIYKE